LSKQAINTTGNLEQQFEQQNFENGCALINGVDMHREDGDGFHIPLMSSSGTSAWDTLSNFVLMGNHDDCLLLVVQLLEQGKSSVAFQYRFVS